MRKIILIALLICTLSVLSQPVLNASDINPLNISQNEFSASSESFGIGNAGAFVIWDFSSLALTPYGLSSSVSVTSGGTGSNSFPTSNFFVVSLSNSEYITGYYNLTPSKLEVLGFIDFTSSVVNFVNPSTVFQFPFLFNTSFTDTSQVSQNNAESTETTTYDAYGTLTTAFGTYNNVIRLKKDEGNGFISYNWFKLNPYQELLTASINPVNSIINYSVKQPTNLATTQNQINNQFSIFPNPTSGNFTIKNLDFSENSTFVNIYDVLGNQIIKNDKIENDFKNINLSDLALGLYFIKIIDVNNTLLYSEKIIKN